jgi:hypothetical protein
MAEEIKVKDRRLFDKDGNINEDAEAAPAEPAGAGSRPAGEPPPRPPLNGDIPATLSTLIIGLATSAMMHLGQESPDGAPGREPDLVAAKHSIDILGILQKKTQGNLDPSEESLLEAMLYDLRMMYVAVKKNSA